MVTNGKCSNHYNKCQSGTFCPAINSTEVECQICDSSITSPQGCNCAANTTIPNCMTCNGAKCAKCIDEFIVNKDGASCDSCSPNCLNCSATDKCTKCESGYFLDGSNACKVCSDPKCTTCSALNTCTIFEKKFVTIEKKFASRCISDNHCNIGEFCDKQQKLCEKCSVGCTLCMSATVCGTCADNKIANTKGVCESSCLDLQQGQYCRQGVPTACGIGITSECKCGSAKYCASCITDNSKCKTCLPGFKMVGTQCTQCDDGYTRFLDLCLESNVCNAFNKCQDGQYCDSEFKCQTCTDPNCLICSDQNTCTSCNNDYVVIDGKCAAMCNNEKPCADTAFCDSTTNSCKVCQTGCLVCKSESICGACADGKIANIIGVCEDKCDELADGKFCKVGVAEDCAQGLTSECKCGNAKYCASCISDNSKCKTCLPGFKMVGTQCTQCDDGADQYFGLCLNPRNSISQADPISGGVIAGIVIAVVVLVGGVGGGLAYHFIRKAKQQNESPINVEPLTFIYQRSNQVQNVPQRLQDGS